MYVDDSYQNYISRSSPASATPPPSPKGDITRIAPTNYSSGYGENWQVGTWQASQPASRAPAPVYNSSPSQGIREYGNPGGIQSAIRTYESMDQPAPAASGPAYVYAGTPRMNDSEDTWRNQVYESRAANTRSYSRGGSSPAQGQSGPARVAQAIPAPEMPEYKAPEYKEPEEDPNVYAKEREIAMGPGLRALRQGTREAIMTASSLDNPNAKSEFIKDALTGYGEGLESVTSGAHKQARQVQMDKRNQQLETYRIKYKAQSDAYMINYQNKINKIATDYANQQAQSQQEAAMGVAPVRQFGDTAAFASKWRNASSQGSYIPGYSGR